MDPRRAEVLSVLGIERFVLRQKWAQRSASPDAVLEPCRSGGEDAESAGLRARVAHCTRCALSETRHQTVFGSGNPSAPWLLVGDAPGADEERLGESWVGEAGALLSAMLGAVGRTREQVFLTHVIKCRPPANRDPKPAELTACQPHLLQQIALQKPELILCLGRIAAQGLLGVEMPLANLRGRIHRLEGHGVPVVVTYHPAYLLQAPGEKRKAWTDLKLARDVADGRAA